MIILDNTWRRLLYGITSMIYLNKLRLYSTLYRCCGGNQKGGEDILPESCPQRGFNKLDLPGDGNHF